MRFYHKNNDKEGDTRVVRKFLWLPLRIGDETRWLECCHLVQTLEQEFDTTSGYSGFVWKTIGWVNDSPK